MADVSLKNQNGKSAGSLGLSDDVFAAEPRPIVVREAFNAYRANQRQGTHSTKTRNTVSGGGKKPWKQKGTGRARQGSIRAHQWRGGAISHGPHPRDYSEKINKKKRRVAFRSVLSSKNNAGAIIYIDAISIAEGKTKNVVKFLSDIGAKGKTLIVTVGKDETLVRAAANLAGAKSNPTRVEMVSSVSIYDLLDCETLVLTSEAAQAFEERLK